eukprot:g123.t1
MASTSSFASVLTGTSPSCSSSSRAPPRCRAPDREVELGDGDGISSLGTSPWLLFEGLHSAVDGGQEPEPLASGATTSSGAKLYAASSAPASASALPVSRFMNPTAYGMFLGLNLKQSRKDQALFTILRPVFLTALPAPWSAQNDKSRDRIFFWNAAVCESSYRHPLEPFFVRLVELLREHLFKEGKDDLAAALKGELDDCGVGKAGLYSKWESKKAAGSLVGGKLEDVPEVEGDDSTASASKKYIVLPEVVVETVGSPRTAAEIAAAHLVSTTLRVTSPQKAQHPEESEDETQVLDAFRGATQNLATTYAGAVSSVSGGNIVDLKMSLERHTGHIPSKDSPATDKMETPTDMDPAYKCGIQLLDAAVGDYVENQPSPVPTPFEAYPRVDFTADVEPQLPASLQNKWSAFETTRDYGAWSKQAREDYRKLRLGEEKYAKVAARGRGAIGADGGIMDSDRLAVSFSKVGGTSSGAVHEAWGDASEAFDLSIAAAQADILTQVGRSQEIAGLSIQKKFDSAVADRRMAQRARVLAEKLQEKKARARIQGLFTMTDESMTYRAKCQSGYRTDAELAYYDGTVAAEDIAGKLRHTTEKLALDEMEEEMEVEMQEVAVPVRMSTMELEHAARVGGDVEEQSALIESQAEKLQQAPTQHTAVAGPGSTPTPVGPAALSSSTVDEAERSGEGMKGGEEEPAAEGAEGALAPGAESEPPQARQDLVQEQEFTAADNDGGAAALAPDEALLPESGDPSADGTNDGEGAHPQEHLLSNDPYGYGEQQANAESAPEPLPDLGAAPREEIGGSAASTSISAAPPGKFVARPVWQLPSQIQPAREELDSVANRVEDLVVKPFAESLAQIGAVWADHLRVDREVEGRDEQRDWREVIYTDPESMPDESQVSEDLKWVPIRRGQRSMSVQLGLFGEELPCADRIFGDETTNIPASGCVGRAPSPRESNVPAGSGTAAGGTADYTGEEFFKHDASPRSPPRKLDRDGFPHDVYRPFLPAYVGKMHAEIIEDDILTEQLGLPPAIRQKRRPRSADGRLGADCSEYFYGKDEQDIMRRTLKTRFALHASKLAASKAATQANVIKAEPIAGGTNGSGNVAGTSAAAAPDAGAPADEVDVENKNGEEVESELTIAPSTEMDPTASDLRQDVDNARHWLATRIYHLTKPPKPVKKVVVAGDVSEEEDEQEVQKKILKLLDERQPRTFRQYRRTLDVMEAMRHDAAKVGFVPSELSGSLIAARQLTDDQAITYVRAVHKLEKSGELNRNGGKNPKPVPKTVFEDEERVNPLLADYENCPDPDGEMTVLFMASDAHKLYMKRHGNAVYRANKKSASCKSEIAKLRMHDFAVSSSSLRANGNVRNAGQGAEKAVMDVVKPIQSARGNLCRDSEMIRELKAGYTLSTWVRVVQAAGFEERMRKSGPEGSAKFVLQPLKAACNGLVNAFFCLNQAPVGSKEPLVNSMVIPKTRFQLNWNPIMHGRVDVDSDLAYEKISQPGCQFVTPMDICGRQLGAQIMRFVSTRLRWALLKPCLHYDPKYRLSLVAPLATADDPRPRKNELDFFRVDVTMTKPLSDEELQEQVVAGVENPSPYVIATDALAESRNDMSAADRRIEEYFMDEQEDLELQWMYKRSREIWRKNKPEHLAKIGTDFQLATNYHASEVLDAAVAEVAKKAVTEALTLFANFAIADLHQPRVKIAPQERLRQIVNARTRATRDRIADRRRESLKETGEDFVKLKEKLEKVDAEALDEEDATKLCSEVDRMYTQIMIKRGQPLHKKSKAEEFADDPFFHILPPVMRAIADTTVYRTYSRVFREIGCKPKDYRERKKELEERQKAFADAKQKSMSSRSTSQVLDHSQSLRSTSTMSAAQREKEKATRSTYSMWNAGVNQHSQSGQLAGGGAGKHKNRTRPTLGGPLMSTTLPAGGLGSHSHSVSVSSSVMGGTMNPLSRGPMGHNMSTESRGSGFLNRSHTTSIGELGSVQFSEELPPSVSMHESFLEGAPSWFQSQESEFQTSLRRLQHKKVKNTLVAVSEQHRQEKEDLINSQILGVGEDQKGNSPSQTGQRKFERFS